MLPQGLDITEQMPLLHVDVNGIGAFFILKGLEPRIYGFPW